MLLLLPQAAVADLAGNAIDQRDNQQGNNGLEQTNGRGVAELHAIGDTDTVHIGDIISEARMF